MRWKVCILRREGKKIKSHGPAASSCTLLLRSYSGQLPGSCCRSHQGYHVCGHTPTPLHGLLHDRCRSQRSRPRVGQKYKQMAMRLSALCWYDLHEAEKRRFPSNAVCFGKAQLKSQMILSLRFPSVILSRFNLAYHSGEQTTPPAMPCPNEWANPKSTHDRRCRGMGSLYKDYSKTRSKHVESHVAVAHLHEYLSQIWY